MNVRPADLGIAKLVTLQPTIDHEDLLTGPQPVDEPLVRTTLANLIRLWSHDSRNLPNYFAEEMRILKVQRQAAAFIGIDLQHVIRNIVPVLEPHAEGPVDKAPWATDDPFELAPVDPLAFPSQAIKDEQFLAGQEELRLCEGCKGAGSVPCATCGGSGQSRCKTCEATGNIKCSNCSGSGIVVQAGQNVENCPRCQQGLVRCPNCSEGLVKCRACHSSGQIQCTTCRGHGKLKQRWKLVTRTDTISFVECACHQPWPIINTELHNEAETVAEVHWAFPATAEPQVPLQPIFPNDLLRTARQMIASALEGRLERQTREERISGVRVRLLGTYVYRIELEHNGKHGLLFVAGRANLLYPVRTPKPSFADRLLSFLNRVLSIVGLGDNQGVDLSYVRAVSQQVAHLLDTECVLSRLSRLGARVAVTPSGYLVTLSENGAGGAHAAFDVAFDMSKSGDLMVVATCHIGKAHRDRFPAALAINHQLPFGCIGLASNEKSGCEEFILVDRRPYASLEPQDYYWTLTEMAESVRMIERDGILA